MKALKFVCIAYVLAISCAPELAFSQTALIHPFTPNLIFQNPFAQDPSDSSTYLKPLAGPSGGNVSTAWLLSQWGLTQGGYPAIMVPSIQPTAPSWSIANSNERVEYYQSSNTYELAQAGNVCIGVNNPNEMDLFLSDPNFIQSAPLSTLGSVQVAANLTITYSNVLSQCNTNMGVYIYSLVLGSTTGQVLFYQITLGNSTNEVDNMGWFFEDASTSPNVFGLDDDIYYAGGGSHAVIGQTKSVNIDVLPRLLQIISTGHVKVQNNVAKLDSNPAHWYIGSMYLGNQNWGGTVNTAQWSNPVLKTWPGGTFMNGKHIIQYSCSHGQPNATQNTWGGGGIWNNVGDGCYQRDAGDVPVPN